MVVIFPFEEAIYRKAGVSVNFVGHPLVDVVKASMSRTEFAERHGLDAGRPIVTLLPGSRRSEIERHYPLIMEACERLSREAQTRGAIQFVLAAAPALETELFAPYAKPGVSVTRVEGATYDGLSAADCAIVASGTATVEAALLGTPMVVVYRVSPTSAFVLMRMVRSPFIAMVNLIAGRRVVPELIQDQFTSEAVVEEVRKLLESPAACDEMKAGLAEVRTKLGPGGAIERAADIFAGML
jgi:lipid-A-disaccharide synthase